ncbi:MAG: aldo/keto reductase, partial [Actinomycetales bacterium]
MAQLVLGTAQWGTGYGITSRVARIDDDELGRIVDVAHRAGITAVDTAPAYGDAEQRLRPYAQQFAITTKVAGRDPAAIRE